MNDGIHVQVPNAYETREDLVSHSAVPYTSIQPPYQYHKEKKKKNNNNNNNSSSPMKTTSGWKLTCRTISSDE